MVKKRYFQIAVFTLALLLIVWRRLEPAGANGLALTSNTDNLQLISIQTKNVSDTGFDLEFTVNDLAVLRDASLIYAYTTDPNIKIDGSNIDSGVIGYATVKLNAMKNIRSMTYHSVYLASVSAQMPRTYYIFAQLRTAGSMSEVKSFTLVANKGYSNYTYIPTTPEPSPVPTPIPSPGHGNVTVKKIDAVTKNALGGAVFALINAAEAELAQGTTNEKGTLAFINVPVGEYTLKEVKAPPGYTPKQTAYPVKVESGKDTAQEIENEAQIYKNGGS